MKIKGCSSCLWVLFLVLVVPGGLRGAGDERPTPADIRLNWFARHLEMKETSVFRNLKWRSIGPDVMSGRITDIAVPKGSAFVIYISAASGGVWRSVNNGTTWEPIWDHASSNSVGDIAVADSNPQILWVGAGESNSSRSSYSGTGVYKTTDGGKTWAHMGLSDTHHIGKIVIDPMNPDIVHVAAIGHLYTKNEERGVFKTTDGGKTWRKVLYIDDNTGVIDLVMDPSDRNTLYAAAWERIRKAWNMTEHGKGSGVFKSTDGGETWARATNGLPAGDMIGRIGLDVSVSNPKVIYALVDNHNARTDKKSVDMAARMKRDKLMIGAEVYRSDDKGETWRKANVDDLADLYYLTISIGYYFGKIRISPDDENEIYILGAPLMRSKDGGKTYEQFSYNALHPDHQAFWIDPGNPDRIIDGNDGGLNLSYDRGKTWADIKMPISQFYSVAVDFDEPFNVYGAIQDNMCWYGPVSSIPGVTGPWKEFPGGESGYVIIDPSDNNTIYSGPGLQRTDRQSGASKRIQPRAKEGEAKLRNTWHAPFILSPHNPQILYYGTQMLQMTLDRGETWNAVSPDLTTNAADKTGDVPFQAITTISESPLKFGLVYLGTDDGNVWMTKNLGAEWEKITTGLPAEKWVSRIEASKFDAGTVYVALNGYRDDDFAAYIFKSSDYGKTWIDIKNNLPCGPINVLREDPKKKDILYVGTDLGVYVTLDRGESWVSLCSNLPTTFVHDIVVHPRDNVLVIGTHGRGVFVMDAEPVQEFGPDLQKKELHLFSIPAAYAADREWASRVGQAQFCYYLANGQTVKAEIFNNSGKLVRTFEQNGDQGINTVIWDLTVTGEDGEERSARPGEYKLTLTAGTQKAEGAFKIKMSR